MSVVQITKAEDYESVIKSDLSVVHFYAQWADQCKQMNDVIEQMAKLEDFKKVKFASIIAEDFPEISLKGKITAVPTILLFKNGNNVARVNGANPTKLSDEVKFHLADLNEAENLEERLKKLINQAPCMVFMKGNRNGPRCGFSKSMIALLESKKIEYETFDILEDNEVREGLKQFSQWPTYPQVYVNGELIGGLDILKELDKAGELLNTLPSKAADTKTNLEDRLKELINQAPCVLFMKGNRVLPRCGFSREIISILEEHKADYETFDILEDNEVREGLKKFSNWPTYPQLYINGTLMGGLDIVKEMSESGDLDTLLPKKKT